MHRRRGQARRASEALRCHSPKPDRRTILRLFGMAAAAVLAPTGIGRPANAQSVDANDPRLLSTRESFRTRRGRAWGYLTRPHGAGPPLPVILLVHGQDGLTAHYRNMARRIALERFVVLAPDFLSLGAESLPERTPEDAVTRAMLDGLDRSTALYIAIGAVDFAVARRETVRRAGVVGYDWGGGLAQELPLESRDVLAAVSFDGVPLHGARAARLRTRLMAHYGAPDAETGAAISELEDALERAGAEHSIHIYDAAAGFHDETAEAYDSDAAELAWTRTINFLNQSLR